MSKTVRRFDFEVTQMSKDDPLPFDPFIQLSVNPSGNTTRTRTPVISAHLMTDMEVDEYVRLLKDDLDSVAKRAKRDLKRAREHTSKRLPKSH